MTTDPRLAPLAAALHPYTCSGKHTPDEQPKPPWCHKVADTILGERGVFLPDGLPTPTAYQKRVVRVARERDATIATLRAALEAVVDGCGNFDCPEHLAIGRAALATAKEAGG